MDAQIFTNYQKEVDKRFKALEKRIDDLENTTGDVVGKFLEELEEEEQNLKNLYGHIATKASTEEK